MSARLAGATSASGGQVQGCAPTVADLASVRGYAYRTFATLFLFPGAERVRALREAAPELRRACTQFDDVLQFGALEMVLRRVEAMRDDSVRALQERYAALFLAGAGPSACAPCESAYVAREDHAGRIAAVLDATYAAARLTPAPDQPPDHAAVELEFASFLCGEEAQFWQEGEAGGAAATLRRERTFVTQHPGRWLAPFAARLARVDAGGFYASVAAETATFVAHDRALIAGLIAYARDTRERGA